MTLLIGNCPCCDSESELRKMNVDTGKPFMIECKGCFMMTDSFATEEEVIKAWSRRPVVVNYGSRLTQEKTKHICERDGYEITGYILTSKDRESMTPHCIVNDSAVRWLKINQLSELIWKKD